ncbi:MAG: hypothetical protein PUF83_05855 [Intestinibaculum porci]|uniref:TPR repeat-containing protein YsoA n=1 Tax=Intestinibaculum porci TaxID=2487118 RepID=A0A3G9J848_9FIRM|nr:hypothetical protein [Intestinibaculum porci]MDD6422570.1 hypothetical protein [Intestinibaculum porci]BBH26692.1 hypothetical protein SG0102_16260 [Intestinibaculum porci]
MIDELMAAGQYAAALEKLADLSDEEVRLKRLICLNSLGEFEKAKLEGKAAKAVAKETYYDVVGQYIMSLKECEDYEEAINILIEELSMPYIPYEYENAFNTAYDEILLAKQDAAYGNEKKQIFSSEEIEVILNKDDVNDDLLYMALDQLQQLNVRILMPSIRQYLENPKKPPFAKTLIMETLIEQQVDEELEVSKFHDYYTFNPSYSPLVLEQMCYNGIGKELVRVLEDENASLLNQCLDYLEYYLYVIYPKDIYEDEYSLVAAALHYYVATLQNIEVDEMDLEIAYNVSMSQVENMLLALKEIE